MIFHVVPFVIAFAVYPRIAVTSRDDQIQKHLKPRTKSDERRSLCRVSTSKIPQKQRFSLLIDERPQTIHASGGDRHAPLTTNSVERDIIFPTPSIHPARAVDHQSSFESRLIVGVHPLEAKTAFYLVPTLFRDEKAPQRRAFTPRTITKMRRFLRTAPTGTVHHISTGHDRLPTEVPEEQPRCSRGNAIVDKQRIAFAHVVPLRKSQSLFRPFFYRFVLRAIRTFRKTIILPRPAQREKRHRRNEQQHGGYYPPLFVSFHRY